MTKTKILHSLTEQMTRHYKLHAHYMDKGAESAASDARSRAWAIYWCGRDLLGEGYADKLDEAQRLARESGRRFQDMLNTL